MAEGAPSRQPGPGPDGHFPQPPFQLVTGFGYILMPPPMFYGHLPPPGHQISPSAPFNYNYHLPPPNQFLFWPGQPFPFVPHYPFFGQPQYLHNPIQATENQAPQNQPDVAQAPAANRQVTVPLNANVPVTDSISGQPEREQPENGQLSIPPVVSSSTEPSDPAPASSLPIDDSSSASPTNESPADVDLEDRDKQPLDSVTQSRAPQNESANDQVVLPHSVTNSTSIAPAEDASPPRNLSLGLDSDSDLDMFDSQLLNSVAQNFVLQSEPAPVLVDDQVALPCGHNPSSTLPPPPPHPSTVIYAVKSKPSASLRNTIEQRPTDINQQETSTTKVLTELLPVAPFDDLVDHDVEEDDISISGSTDQSFESHNTPSDLISLPNEIEDDGEEEEPSPLAPPASVTDSDETPLVGREYNGIRVTKMNKHFFSLETVHWECIYNECHSQDHNTHSNYLLTQHIIPHHGEELGLGSVNPQKTSTMTVDMRQAAAKYCFPVFDGRKSFFKRGKHLEGTECKVDNCKFARVKKNCQFSVASMIEHLATFHGIPKNESEGKYTKLYSGNPRLDVLAELSNMVKCVKCEQVFKTVRGASSHSCEAKDLELEAAVLAWKRAPNYAGLTYVRLSEDEMPAERTHKRGLPRAGHFWICKICSESCTQKLNLATHVANVHFPDGYCDGEGKRKKAAEFIQEATPVQIGLLHREIQCTYVYANGHICSRQFTRAHEALCHYTREHLGAGKCRGGTGVVSIKEVAKKQIEQACAELQGVESDEEFWKFWNSLPAPPAASIQQEESSPTVGLSKKRKSTGTTSKDVSVSAPKKSRKSNK